jgi:TonB-linked SusC/RagA family outer membrane protein
MSEDRLTRRARLRIGSSSGRRAGWGVLVTVGWWVACLMPFGPTVRAAAQNETTNAAQRPSSRGMGPLQPGSRQAADSVLRHLVSLDMRDVPLKTVLDEIDRQARLGITYTPRIVPVSKRVTIHVDGVTAGDALMRVLQGTHVIPVITSAGTVMLVRQEEGAARPVERTGAVLVRVVDTTTAEPLAGAVVGVKGTNLTATTNEQGYTALLTVPSGVHVITARHIGYAPAEKEVAVLDSQAVRVELALKMTMSRLQDVVVTATGPRRRLELGNDITVISADSIVATQPVPNVTALLEGRVPGLTVQHTSGAPGDPSRLRLRGPGSLTRSNDPIVIVDGVRVYAAQSDQRSANLASPPDVLGAYAGRPGAFGAAAPSPLDQIDPNTIAVIEVLKGPSAATLYGADAANGVIVITTKQGRSGSPRWSLGVERGLSYIPGRYPEQYLRWGHNFSDNAPRWCPVTDFTCVADSLARFQPLNDPNLSPLGHGHRTAVTLGVSGGSEVVQYAFTGSASEDVGLLTLPGFAIRQFQTAQGAPPPSWMQRPHNYTTFSGTSRMTVRLGSQADVALTTMFSRDHQQRTSLEDQLGVLMYTYVDPATSTYLTASSNAFVRSPQLLSGFYQRTTDVATNFRNALNLSWRPTTWLSGSADAGLDLIRREDEVLLPRKYSPADDSVGLFNRGTGSSLVGSVNLRGTVTAPLPWGFALQTAAGANYTSSRTDDATFFGTDIPVGVVSPGQAKYRTFDESRSELTTFGWYIEPTLSRKRIWISTGIRLDGGNTFGTQAKLAGFPKVSASYLISDEPFFPLKGVFNTLRLRAAYGHAGVQPGIGDRLRIYTAPSAAPLDSQWVDIITLQALGNTDLKPERSTEFEGGFDADLLDNRLSFGLTAYRKTRRDALMRFPLPPSVYGEGASIMRNIGVVRNTGVEATLSAQLMPTDGMAWSVQASVSTNKNVVVSLAPGVAGLNNTSTAAGGVGSLFRLEEGYPLFGIWARPIVAYTDVNQDGVITPGEVQVGDSAAYMGSSEPDYEVSLHTGISLLRGAVHVDAGFLYQHGMTQINAADVGRMSASQALNDSNTPLERQAGIIVLAPDLGSGLTGQGATAYAAIQTVSLLRFNSLSVTYNAPAWLAQRLGASAMSVALQGTNLGLFTSYRGKDPNVNAYPNGNNVLDVGGLPVPRTWQVRVSLRY